MRGGEEGGERERRRKGRFCSLETEWKCKERGGGTHLLAMYSSRGRISCTADTLPSVTSTRGRRSSTSCFRTV